MGIEEDRGCCCWRVKQRGFTPAGMTASKASKQGRSANTARAVPQILINVMMKHVAPLVRPTVLPRDRQAAGDDKSTDAP